MNQTNARSQQSFAPHILQFIDSIHRMTGFRVVWKNKMGLAVEGVPPEKYCNHRCAFCKRVKRIPGALRKCIKDDVYAVERDGAQAKKPFIKTCHAGVCEVVVPLWPRENFSGVLYLGPFRKQDARSVYQETESQFAKLPIFVPKAHKDIAKVLWLSGTALLSVCRDAPARPPLGTIRDARVSGVIDYIDANLNADLSIPNLARQVHLSASRLEHLFRKETNTTLKAYTINARIRLAKQLISSGTCGLYEVALKTGFEEYTYFSTVFRRTAGVCPSEYRDQAGKVVDI